MPAQDMLDIVNYCFESDSLDEKETADAKRKMRGTIYTQLYDRPYRWGSSAEDGEFGTQDVASGDVYSDSAPSSSAASAPSSGAPRLTHKPYIPPTPVDPTSAKPFGNVLDPPIG